MTKPLLDFTTLAPDRPTVRIDGIEYELALLDDFGIREQARLAGLLRQAAALETEVEAMPALEPTGNAATDAALATLGPLSDDQAERVAAFIDQVVGVILHAPAEVRARLSEPQKRLIIVTFMPTVQRPAAPNQAMPAKPSRSTSAASRRNSRRPTAPVRG